MTDRFERPGCGPGGGAPFSIAFIPMGGDPLQVELGLGQVNNHRAAHETAAIIERRVLKARTLRRLAAAQLTALADSDLERIDRITLEFGVDALRRLSARPRMAAVSLYLATLRRAAGRDLICGALSDARARVGGGLVVAVEQVEAAPPEALRAAAAWLRPRCQRVLGVVTDPAPRVFEALRLDGFDAAALTPPDGHDLATFNSWVFDLMEMSGGLPLSLSGLSPQQAALAARQGVAHLWVDVRGQLR